MSDWEDDCLRWRGLILTGKRAHWCDDFDGLPVDDTCWEASVCHCYDGDPEARSTAELEAISTLLPAIETYGPPF